MGRGPAAGRPPLLTSLGITDRVWAAARGTGEGAGDGHLPYLNDGPIIMSMSATILVVEDDPLQSQILCDILEAAGFTTVSARDGVEGLRLLYQHQPDLVILDVVMPALDGWDVCRRIRELSTVPIIFITVRGSDEERVKGLRLGADDYLVKPFVPAELQARVEAVLRRAHMSPPDRRRILRFGNGDLIIEPDARRVIVRGNPVDLTLTEYRLLLFMAERAGRVLSVDVLLDELWPNDLDANVDNVRWHTWRLRRKIEKDPDHPEYIFTERGLGYRFVTS
jgi:DNA-binding response OmpR family regulator